MSRSVDIGAVEELGRVFEGAAGAAEAIASVSLYEGAKEIADAISAELNSLETETYRFADETNPRKVSPYEKDWIIENAGIGIAHFKKSSGEVHTAIGINPTGYDEFLKSLIPTAPLVRSVNSGSSFRVKQPYIRKGANKAKQKAITVISTGMSRRALQALDKGADRATHDKWIDFTKTK